MQHGEREVNCRGEGERGRERKKKMEEENLGFLWVDGYCATLKASKTNQVHLTPPNRPQRMELLKGGRTDLLGESIFWGSGMEKLCLPTPTTLQGEIKLRESFSGHL